jgi:hypothetical protein
MRLLLGISLGYHLHREKQKTELGMPVVWMYVVKSGKHYPSKVYKPPPSLEDLKEPCNEMLLGSKYNPVFSKLNYFEKRIMAELAESLYLFYRSLALGGLSFCSNQIRNQFLDHTE